MSFAINITRLFQASLLCLYLYVLAHLTSCHCSPLAADTMEPRRTARRSASHGALHSAYSSHTRPPPPPFGPLRPPSHCRSLRNVKENVSFLTSPGPLESMLKTTTETGDIGIFSIGPPGPRRYAGHHPPRASTGISESNLPRRSETRGSDSGRFPDDRRRLPSYRDTTSEILSLYGSESHNSAQSSALSRRFDDRGPRSYSMTSYGSRRAQTNMSNSNARTHSGVGLQRPRSPFPYPTRLKRPGVRPSSPALTENGSVDYSRMVGVDHVSYVGSPAHQTREMRAVDACILICPRGLSTGRTNHSTPAISAGCHIEPLTPT